MKIELQKRFLVTGGAGFIGSNICLKLVKSGYQVKCLDNLSTGNINNLKEVMNESNFEFIYGDIRKKEDCKIAMQGVDYVLHQAALGSVPRSFKNPKLYCENNVLGFLNILEAAKEESVLRVIYASSSSVYGDNILMPKKEGQEGNALSPYALTKQENEKWARLYTEYYGLATIGLRYFNVFGRRQNPNGEYAAVIPKFIKLIQENKVPEIYGDGKQIRDFTYIDNVIDANCLACVSDNKAIGKSFNIASGESQILNSVYRKISNFYNFKENPIYLDERIGDIKKSYADISEANKYLGYVPRYSFQEGLIKTLQWYDAMRM